VIYDRAGSAFAELTAERVDWSLLLDTRVLHLTGITPALGGDAFEIVLEAIERVKALGVTVSFDVNYRSKLWTSQAARARLTPLLPFVDLLICAQADARTVFGLDGPPKAVLDALHALTPAEHVVLTQAAEGASMVLGGELVHVPAREATVLDRLGAGDAFAAGMLDGLLDGDLRGGLGRGAALSALALAQHGDMLITSREELNAVLEPTPNLLKR